MATSSIVRVLKGATITFSDDEDWLSGFSGHITVTNTGSTALDGWSVGFTLKDTLTDVWGAALAGSNGSRYNFNANTSQSAIAPGGSVTIGFVAHGAAQTPVNLSLISTKPAPVLPAVIQVQPTLTVAGTSVSVAAPPTVPSSAGSLLPSGYLSTSGSQIVGPNGTPVRISAVNWFGLETNTFSPNGLWAQNYKTMMNQMVQLGFNAIRLPFSDQLFDAGSTPNGIDFTKNPDLVGLNGLQLMDKIVDYAGQIGLKIILDHHRSAAGGGPNANGLWYDSGYSEQRWIDDWTMLAKHYAGNTTVIAADLANEPHDQATWGDGTATDWRAAAIRAGDAVQAVNPNWLILVEGTSGYNYKDYTWYGSNLEGVADHPVTLTVPNKLVYSVHDYPSTVSNQAWFSDPNYPNNLPSVWNKYWGYVVQSGIAPVLVGEYGTKLQTSSDQQWLVKLVDYMDGDFTGTGTSSLAPGQQGVSWAYWDWNPNSGDTGGILQDDWSTVNTDKIAAISPGFYHAGSISASGTVTSAPLDFTVSLSAPSKTPVTVHYSTADGSAHAGTNYVATSGDLTFAPGDTAKIVAAQILDPPGATGTLGFILSLSASSGATVTSTSANGVIVYGTAASTPPTSASPPTTTPVHGAATSVAVTNDWGSGVIADGHVTNTSSAASHGWTAIIETADHIVSVWNGTLLAQQGSRYTIGNASWNGDLAPNQTATFGLQATESHHGVPIHIVSGRVF